ncbi:hypothetical protein C8F04DRAFT_1123437 [Mycena alexandri]|uniref:Uncharacterized protein n=1 Tax=Mycena alexandri TaxID=1745969 RepID=A0AAD6SFP3_9AGAR|nr:hypothetical protein C8F04DRAFT_1123437 [Mycena alexandri]
MTEYDFSEEGRRRQIETQNRISTWVRSTESSPQLKSPFSAPSHTGSSGSGRPHHRGAGSQQPPMSHRTHQSYRQLQRPSRSVHSGSGSRSSSQKSSHTSTLFPSPSISHAPVSPSTHYGPAHSSHRSSHHSSHHACHHPQPRTYIVSPPPSTEYSRTPGVIILPRHGQAPQVVFY